MQLNDEIDQYESLMERLVGAYKARISKICKEGELTPPQFFALSTIRELGQSKMSPLADALGLSMGAASTLVDRLVSRGLVERCTDPTDRRAVYVSLTERGLAVLDEAVNARRDTTRQIFTRLTPQARTQLLAGLVAMVEAWEQLPTDV